MALDAKDGSIVYEVPGSDFETKVGTNHDTLQGITVFHFLCTFLFFLVGFWVMVSICLRRPSLQKDECLISLTTTCFLWI